VNLMDLLAPATTLPSQEHQALNVMAPQTTMIEHALPSGAAKTLEAFDPALQGMGLGVGLLGALGRMFDKGGSVEQGNPQSRQDDVVAKLSHGEFVINREAVKHFGPVLKLINKTFQPDATAPDPQTAQKLATELFRVARRMHAHGRTGQRTTT